MSKKWTRRSALGLIGSGAGLLTWGTGGFTDVTVDRQVNIDTTADDSSSDDPLLGITTHDDQLVFETETRPLVTLTNNTGSKLDTVGATVQNPVELNFDVELGTFPNSLDVGDSGEVTATITGSGNNRIKETGQIELEIFASSTAPNSAPEITASRSVSLSCVNCINFENPETGTPSGFIPDTGRTFGLRDEFDSKSTLYYGWESEQTDTTRNRGGSLNTEEKTLAHFTTNSRIPTAYDASLDPYWEIDLPDGWYDVTIYCQDPSYSDQEYSFDVAGGAETVELRDTNFDDETNQRSTQGKSYTFSIEVDDEKLSITPPDGTYNPKINWLRFESRNEAADPANFNVKITSDSSITVNQGDIASIAVEIENTGEQPGVQEIMATVEDAKKDSQTISLTAGEKKTIQLDWDTSDETPGTYELKANSNDTSDTTEVKIRGVDITATGASDKRQEGDYSDYYFKITHNFDDGIEPTGVRVDSTTADADSLYRDTGSYQEVEMDVTNDWGHGTDGSYSESGADYEDGGWWWTWYEIGDYIDLDPIDYPAEKLQSNGDAEIGLFSFRSRKGNGQGSGSFKYTDMNGETVDITLWYTDPNGDERKTSFTTD
ncbi:hypothetical protein [Haloarcula amylolytica]|uniref:hypothetical protein n=1 Tax=Haloarcula amylolytica TaxID=396317 RepID=UPI003C78BFB9